VCLVSSIRGRGLVVDGAAGNRDALVSPGRSVGGARGRRVGFSSHLYCLGPAVSSSVAGGRCCVVMPLRLGGCRGALWFCFALVFAFAWILLAATVAVGRGWISCRVVLVVCCGVCPADRLCAARVGVSRVNCCGCCVLVRWYCSCGGMVSFAGANVYGRGLSLVPAHDLGWVLVVRWGVGGLWVGRVRAVALAVRVWVVERSRAGCAVRVVGCVDVGSVMDSCLVCPVWDWASRTSDQAF